jgi:hypothetical protein
MKDSKNKKSIDLSWKAIFDKLKISKHNFNNEPYYLSAKDIKRATKSFSKTNQREVRILCYQTTKESRPQIFKENELFILPIKNGEYVIVKGKGYIDIPEIKSKPIIYESKLNFELDTINVGNSEMQHLDFSYASSMIRTFMQDESLVLTIRGRKYTPPFEFYVGEKLIKTKGVQTEVDAGYEGKKQIVLVEAKNLNVKNTIIRQLYYPFRQWQSYSEKKVVTLFFEKREDEYSIWMFEFKEPHQYESIELVKKEKFLLN